MPVVAAARTDARVPADVAAEVVGLGQRALGARRGHLEPVALAHLGQQLGDALAQRERDALRVVDEEAHELAADDLREQHLHLRLRRCQPGLDVGLYRAHLSLVLQQKSGRAPAFNTRPGVAKALADVIAPAVKPRAGALSRAKRSSRSRAGPVAVDPVVVAVGPQAGGERQRPARLVRAAALHQRAAEAEQRVVVRRRALDDRLELDRRLLEVARAEVGAAERLADRRLLWLDLGRLRQRDGRLVELALLEQSHPPLEQLVYVRHVHPAYP